MNADHFIQRFHLLPHPEGGYYARTHSPEDGRFSSIHFLLTRDHFSAFHRIRSDEQWNWYYGDDIIIHEIDAAGNYEPIVLSNQPGSENFQHVVPGGHWFASECRGTQGFAFCGCTVVPAFRFEEFELADRASLTGIFPQHRSLIEKLTRA